MIHESPTAWVTGAGGLIGSYICRAAAAYAARWRVVGLVRSQLDLTDNRALREKFRKDRPQLIVHCAALSRSPACQANPDLARKLNVEITRSLAELAESIPFIFFSTDLVFDGREGHYDESARVNPLSVYAETKVEAEQIVLANPNHLVIRTSLNGGTSPTGDRGFNEELRRAWQAGQTLKLFVDEFRSPLPAAVTARAVWELAAASCRGIYHVAGQQRLSRYELGELIAERCRSLNPRYERASLKEYNGPPRSPDTSLNCAKAQALLTFPLPGFTDWLKEHPDF